MNRRLSIAVALLLAMPFAASAGEVLVLTTATRVDPTPVSARRGVEIQNNGPNNIACQLRTSSGLTAVKGRIISPGDAWPVAAGSGTAIYCIAATANQVTGSATFVSEVQ